MTVTATAKWGQHDISALRTNWRALDRGVWFGHGMLTFGQRPNGATEWDHNIYDPGDTLWDNIDAWMQAALSFGAKSVTWSVHDAGGMCQWFTDITTYSLGTTDWAQGPNGFDVTERFVERARHYNLGVDLYMSIGDYQCEFDGLSQSEMRTYKEAQITEILTRWGHIDALWFDTGLWYFGTYYPWDSYAQMQAFVRSVDPDTLILNNTHSFNYSNSDIAIYEHSDPIVIDPLPPANSTFVRQLARTMRDDGFWLNQPGNGDGTPITLEDALEYMAAASAANANFLLEVTARQDGTIPPDQVARLAEIGAALA